VTEPDPHLLGPGLAPTPFTADEIREGCRPGRSITVETTVDGRTTRSTSRFLSRDAEGGDVEHSVLDGSGAVVEREVGHDSWADLQTHAAFPADRTTVEPARLDTPMGPADCLLYTVTEGAVTKRFWFDTARPGMPVRMETEEAGAVTAVRAVVADERR
jgi:hypothetical protein